MRRSAELRVLISLLGRIVDQPRAHQRMTVKGAEEGAVDIERQREAFEQALAELEHRGVVVLGDTLQNRLA